MLFKKNDGIAASDALIAVLIITLFSGLIASISYNIYLANSSVKRMSKATGYIVEMFEYIDKSYYDNVTQENLEEYFNNKYYYEQDGITPKDNPEAKLNDENANTPFKLDLSLTKYNETEGNENKLDLVKEINMSVTYKLGNRNQTIEMTKIKSRESIKTPNTPDLSKIQEDGYNIYPLKYTNKKWKVCDKNDSSWYDYLSGKWALAIKTNSTLNIDDIININNNQNVYAWIPRYAYNQTNNSIKFLFSNTNSYVINTAQTNGFNQLEEIGNSYVVPNDFSENGKELTGIWETIDSEASAYEYLDSIYELKK